VTIVEERNIKSASTLDGQKQLRTQAWCRYQEKGKQGLIRIIYQGRRYEEASLDHYCQDWCPKLFLLHSLSVPATYWGVYQLSSPGMIYVDVGFSPSFGGFA
jgi:hypothetical protein